MWTWIELLKFGLPGLAAVFGFFVAAKVRNDFKDKRPTKADERILNRFMLFCLALLVISGIFSISDELFIKSDKRLADIREHVHAIGVDLENKLTFEQGTLACLSQPVRDYIEPAIYRMCYRVKSIAEIAQASPPNCKTEREQPRLGQPVRC
jgi:hypothetical protein